MTELPTDAMITITQIYMDLETTLEELEDINTSEWPVHLLKQINIAKSFLKTSFETLRALADA